MQTMASWNLEKVALSETAPASIPGALHGRAPKTAEVIVPPTKSAEGPIDEQIPGPAAKPSPVLLEESLQTPPSSAFAAAARAAREVSTATGKHASSGLVLLSLEEQPVAILMVVWTTLATVLCILVFFALIWYHSRIWGKAFEVGIETYDRNLIGVDVEIESMTVLPFTGRIEVKNLAVKNPKNYKTPYLLTSQSCMIDLNMGSLACSWGRNVTVDKLHFTGADVTIEKSWTSTNVQDVIKFVKNGEEEAKKEAEKEKNVVVDREVDADADSAKGDSDNDKKTVVTLKEVFIRDLGVRFAASMLRGASVRIECSDIEYNNFTEEVGPSMVDDVARFLLATVLKIVAAKAL